MGLWVYGFMGLWVYGFMGLWVYGFKFPSIPDINDSRVYRVRDPTRYTIRRHLTIIIFLMPSFVDLEHKDAGVVTNT